MLFRSHQILSLTQNLYDKFSRKRVFYSAYIPLATSPLLPSANTPVPLLREHRLYQADWLLRFYGFRAEEIVDQKNQNLNCHLDPKTAWALRNFGKFPIEINSADYETILRIPGIGVKSANAICQHRRFAKLSFDDLKKIGVVLKRAKFFIWLHTNSVILYIWRPIITVNL